MGVTGGKITSLPEVEDARSGNKQNKKENNRKSITGNITREENNRKSATGNITREGNDRKSITGDTKGELNQETSGNTTRKS